MLILVLVNSPVGFNSQSKPKSNPGNRGKEQIKEGVEKEGGTIN